MRRRTFIAGVGAAAVVGPIAARAQQPGKVPIIGFLGSASASSWSHWAAAFVQRLREHGWIDGNTIVIDFRWAEGRSERYTEIASEFAQLKVDIIVTSGAPVAAAMRATSSIPIVFAGAIDPLGTGMVASLARPGGNVTGLSAQGPDLVGKRLELFRELFPGFRRLGVFANLSYPAAVLEMEEAQKAARIFGLEVFAPTVRQKEDIAAAFETFKSGAEAVYVCSDPLTNTHRININQLALGAKLPTMYNNREYVDTMGLMSYGPDITRLWRRAADYADKILRGAKPAELPVEQPTTYELIINLKTAKALGLTVPPTLLARADEVIE